MNQDNPQSSVNNGGYTCACRQWVMWGTYHSCPGGYYPYPNYSPQIIYTSSVPVEVVEKLDQIPAGLQEIKESLEKILKKLDDLETDIIMGYE